MLAAGRAFVLLVSLTSSLAVGQSLNVLPVSVQIPFGQKATTLTVINRGNAPTSIQIRPFIWRQSDGSDQLTATDAILVSPPLATIAPGSSQIIRLALRRSPDRREDTYRLLLDQLPPPSEPGVVHVVVRMSIPVFAQPKFSAASHIQFHLERTAAQMSLVGINDGVLHESLHGMGLWAENGRKLATEMNGPQYILAGATRRWPIPAQDPALPLHHNVRLIAVGLSGSIDQKLLIVDTP